MQLKALLALANLTLAADHRVYHQQPVVAHRQLATASEECEAKVQNLSSVVDRDCNSNATSNDPLPLESVLPATCEPACFNASYNFFNGLISCIPDSAPEKVKILYGQIPGIMKDVACVKDTDNNLCALNVKAAIQANVTDAHCRACSLTTNEKLQKYNVSVIAPGFPFYEIAHSGLDFSICPKPTVGAAAGLSTAAPSTSAPPVATTSKPSSAVLGSQVSSSALVGGAVALLAVLGSFLI